MKESLFHVIIKAVGEAISGKTVKLVASNDVSLRAATNTSEKLENAKSKGWSVGANISVAGGGILGFDASANAAKQKSNTKVTTHTGTTIVGSDAVTITSGKDTHISGSKVIGKSVTADVGGNLSIESLQDTKTYVGESSNKGFSVSTNAGSLSNVSMSSSKGKMKSDYASVTDQAGIYAGDGGFVINTAETTSLTGAVIDSTADTNKNKLSTKSLDVKDVENTAEYTSRNVGMSYNHVGNFKNLSKAGKNAVWNTLGTLPNLLPDSSKSSSSTTKSAISNGTIEVRDANFNMQTLSRDTKDSLNKLDEIFDKKKIEERQELSKLFAKEAFGQLHNWNPTSKEGKAAKAIAHGVVAEVSARMAGNKPGSGFYAGATNEALIGEIQKIAKEKPDVAQTLSALLGAAVNGSLGYSPVTGAAEAQYGTKWNQSGVMPKNKDYIFVRYDGQIWRRSALGRDEFLDSFGVWKHVNPGDVYVVQRSRHGEQAMGDEYRYDGNQKSTYVLGDGGIIEVGINEAYANGFNTWDPSKNPALPYSTATGTWADYHINHPYNDSSDIDESLVSDTNTKNSYSLLTSVVNNAPKNFATGTVTYVGENAFGKTVEKSYLSVSKPLNNDIRVRDAKMLGSLGGKAYNVGLYGNSFNENNERYQSVSGKSISTAVDTLNVAHDLEIIKVKPKIKPSKNKVVNVLKIGTYKLIEAGAKGTVIDTTKDLLDKVDERLEEVEQQRRERARQFWPF